MSLKFKRLLFLLAWLIIIFSGPISVIRNSDIDSVVSDPVILTNFFQRLTGLLAFSILFVQIVLGSWMNNWIQIIGARAYKLHITQGLIAYGFVLIHPIFQNAIIYQTSRSLSEALLVFVPSLNTQRDILLVFGRSAFILATIAVVAAYFRTKPFFRRNWKAFHILNYLVFYLVLIHSRIGTDIKSPPFSWIYWTAAIVVTVSIGHRLFSPFFRKLAQPAIIKQQK